MSPTQTAPFLRRALLFFARYLFYPLCWLWVALALARIIAAGGDARGGWFLITLPILLFAILLENLAPLERRFGQSLRRLPADIVFAVLAGASAALTAALLAMASITVAGRTDGPLSAAPLLVQVIAVLLLFELVNYSLHRFMHEGRGRLGAWAWRIHAAHHLPEGLYVLMHAVNHPLNVMMIQACAIILPVWALGVGPDAALIFTVLNAFHGIISHFNIDMRMGWANYLFVGPELHRYHHSADLTEAKNYGATIPFWDIVFGSFVYRPGQAPQALGVAPEAGLPEYARFMKVLALPFTR